MGNLRIQLPLSLLLLLPVLAAPAAAQLATGSYAGDGVAGRRIVGLGFRPDVVIVKVDYTNATPTLGYAVLRTSTMTGDNSKPLIDATALSANLIQSLDGDGFTLGNAENVNGLGTCGGPCTYHWMAFKTNADLKVGTYVGDGAPTQSITGLGFSPDYVVTLPEVAKRALNRTSRGTNQSKRFDGALIPDGIVSMDAGGFTVASAANGNDDQNASLTTYHYVAWNEAPGKMRVGEYTGNGSDDRNVGGVGFQPEVAIVQLYSDDREARFRTADMPFDLSGTFNNEVSLGNRIQAFLPDGFQVGSHDDVNELPGGCAGPSDCEYAWVAFNAYPGCCPSLSTSDAVSVVTVTAPDSWEMVFERIRGGSIRGFHDLAEDPTRTTDLAGGIGSQEGLFIDEINWPGDGSNHRTDKRPRARLRVLEATPTRVQVRSESHYHLNNAAGGEIPGIQAVGENTLSPAGRNALHWRRITTSSVDTDFQQIHLNVHHQTSAPLDSWAGYTESGPIATVSGNGPGSDDFVMLQSDQPFARTDFLQILYQDWADASGTFSDTNSVNEWIENSWMRTSSSTVPAGATETFNFLMLFKPTTLASHLDPQVTGRRDDYRQPDDLASPSPFLAGGGWFDPNENTSSPSDFYNEAEAAYSLEFDPAGGLAFDLDGGTIARYQPTFKIRQWRSLSAPDSVTLESQTLVRDVDYKADLVPISRSPFHRDLLWHSTLQDAAALGTPDVGSAGSLAGGVSFEPARFGQGARTSASADWIAIPTASNFDPAVGKLSFWYRPSYDSHDGQFHDICGVVFDANNRFVLEKRADNNIYFLIVAGGAVSELQVASTSYHWPANDWVQIALEWRDTAALGGQQHLYMDELELGHTDPVVDYDSANLTLGAEFRFGNTDGDATFAPGVYDEIEIVTGVTAVIASGGVIGSADEWLADPSPGKNFTLNFTPTGADRRGRYLIFGAADRFRGLNVALETPGAGVPPGALQWEYWNGTAWADLESVSGFTDETESFTRDGTIFWADDPPGWTPYATFGGAEIYRIRVHLAPGFSYTTFPVEALILTDILIFQFCGEITADSQTFSFSVPVPTQVHLASFEARGMEEAIELGWETASELRNLGFHLYRSEAAEGPYERITETLIPGLGSSPAGARYRHRDAGLESGRRYFYRLEDVETSGRTELHGPVSAAALARSAEIRGPSRGRRRGVANAAPAVRVLERTARFLVLELSTEGFDVERLRDGSVRLSIPGFSEELEPGAPALPVKETWVEAAAEGAVRIDWVREERIERFSPLRPRPAGAPEILATPRGSVRAGKRSRGEGAAYQGRGLFPERAAWVSADGYQREDRKIQLRLAPLRWDRTSGELVLAKRLWVRLSFSSSPPDRRNGERRRRVSLVKRLSVTEPGLYAVSFEQVMGSRGRDVATSLLRLSRLGRSASFHVEPDAGRFGPGSVLYFFSEGERLNPYERQAVYELELAGSGAPMEVVDASPAGGELDFGFRREAREENRYYQAGLLEAEDLWFWDVLLAPVEKSFSFRVEAPRSTEPARLRVWIQGATDFPASPDHHLRIAVNGAPLAEAFLEGKKPRTVTAEIPAGVLREGENRLELSNSGGTQAPYSMILLDRFEIEYPTRPVASEGRWEGAFSRSGTAHLEGLEEGALALELGEEPRWLSGASSSAGTLSFSVPAGRRVLAVDPRSVLAPVVSSPDPSRLATRLEPADYLLLAPRALLPAAKPLLDSRRSQGLTVRAVALEEVYSEFGHGEKRPEAIRDFVSFAYHHGREPRPRYLLLLGDASYDFKDYLGTGAPNHVPALGVKTSYLWTASDPALAAVHGDDDFPDLAVGRLPASDLDEARAMVEKILAFEERPHRIPSFVLVADDPDAGGDFESHAEEIAGGVLASREIRKIYLSRLGLEAARSAILDSFDRGASLMSYVGHGGIHLWAQENLLDLDRVGSLSPQPEQPLVLTLNCLNGYFHFPYFNSLSEELVKAKGRGAIAAFSPTGLSLEEPAHLLHRILLQEILSGAHERLGDALSAAQSAYAVAGGSTELLRIYHLLGDPALLLR